MWYTWWKKQGKPFSGRLVLKGNNLKQYNLLFFFFFSIKIPTHTKIIKKHLHKLADVQRNKMNGIMGFFSPRETVTSIL